VHQGTNTLLRQRKPLFTILYLTYVVRKFNGHFEFKRLCFGDCQIRFSSFLVFWFPIHPKIIPLNYLKRKIRKERIVSLTWYMGREWKEKTNYLLRRYSLFAASKPKKWVKVTKTKGDHASVVALCIWILPLHLCHMNKKRLWVKNLYFVSFSRITNFLFNKLYYMYFKLT